LFGPVWKIVQTLRANFPKKTTTMPTYSALLGEHFLGVARLRVGFRKKSSGNIGGHVRVRETFFRPGFDVVAGSRKKPRTHPESKVLLTSIQGSPYCKRCGIFFGECWSRFEKYVPRTWKDWWRNAKTYEKTETEISA
jgi:hypothetical protein